MSHASTMGYRLFYEPADVAQSIEHLMALDLERLEAVDPREIVQATGDPGRARLIGEYLNPFALRHALLMLSEESEDDPELAPVVAAVIRVMDAHGRYFRHGNGAAIRMALNNGIYNDAPKVSAHLPQGVWQRFQAGQKARARHS